MSEKAPERPHEINRVLGMFLVVARLAKQLQIRPVIGTSACERNDMINVVDFSDRAATSRATGALKELDLDNVRNRKVAAGLGFRGPPGRLVHPSFLWIPAVPSGLHCSTMLDIGLPPFSVVSSATIRVLYKPRSHSGRVGALPLGNPFSILYGICLLFLLGYRRKSCGTKADICLSLANAPGCLFSRDLLLRWGRRLSGQTHRFCFGAYRLSIMLVVETLHRAYSISIHLSVRLISRLEMFPISKSPHSLFGRSFLSLRSYGRCYFFGRHSGSLRRAVSRLPGLFVDSAVLTLGGGSCSSHFWRYDPLSHRRFLRLWSAMPSGGEGPLGVAIMRRNQPFQQEEAR